MGKDAATEVELNGMIGDILLVASHSIFIYFGLNLNCHNTLQSMSRLMSKLVNKEFNQDNVRDGLGILFGDLKRLGEQVWNV